MRHAGLVAALVLGATVRLFFLADLAPYPRHERMLNRLDDQAVFFEWGSAIARGERFDLAGSPHEWAYWAVKTPAVPPQAPFYPWLVGAAFAVDGAKPFAVRLLQVAAGLLTIACVHRIARRRFDDPAATVAALGAALYAPWIFYEAALLRTAWLTLALAGLVVAFDRVGESAAGERPGRRRAFAAGLLAALATLLQEQFLPLGIAGAIWTARRRPGLGRWVAAGLLALLMPAFLVASLRAGRPVLATASAPFNLLIANLHDGDGGVAATTPAYDAIKARDANQPVNLYRELATDIRSHPGDVLRRELQKLRWLFTRVELADNLNFELGRLENRALRAAPLDAPTLAPLALAGLALCWRRRRGGSVLVPFLALYALSLLVFVPQGRLRQPLAVALIVLAAAGGCEIWRRAAGKKGLAAAAIAALLALGFLLRPDPESWIRPNDWTISAAAWRNESVALRRDGRAGAARAALVEARLRNPASEPIFADLEALDRELRTPPSAALPPEAEALCADAARAAAAGDRRAARGALERATQIAPANATPWRLLANVEFLDGEKRRAAQALERALRADPYDRAAAANLAALRGGGSLG